MVAIATQLGCLLYSFLQSVKSHVMCTGKLSFRTSQFFLNLNDMRQNCSCFLCTCHNVVCIAVLLLFYIASQTGNHAQCFDDDGKGEKIKNKISYPGLWGVTKTVSLGISP